MPSTFSFASDAINDRLLAIKASNGTQLDTSMTTVIVEYLTDAGEWLPISSMAFNPATAGDSVELQNSLSPTTTSKAPTVAAVLAGLDAVLLEIDAADYAAQADYLALKARVDTILSGSVDDFNTFFEAWQAFLQTQSAQAALSAALDGKLSKAANLSDVNNASTARTNLGVVPAQQSTYGLVTLGQMGQIAQDALNVAPLVYAYRDNGASRLDFTDVQAALFWAQGNGFGGIGGSVILTRPSASAPLVGQATILNLNRNPLKVTYGVHLYGGAKVINNALIYGGIMGVSVTLRAGAFTGTTISGGILDGQIVTSSDYTNSTPLILDNVQVINNSAATYATGGAILNFTIIMRNGSSFFNCTPDPATIIIYEPAPYSRNTNAVPQSVRDAVRHSSNTWVKGDLTAYATGALQTAGAPVATPGQDSSILVGTALVYSPDTFAAFEWDGTSDSSNAWDYTYKQRNNGTLGWTRIMKTA